MKLVMAWAVLIILPATVLAAGLETAFLPDGAEYLVDRFMITTRVGVPPLAIGQALSGKALTGVNSIDNLCAENNVVLVEPFYPAPVKSPGLVNLIPRMYILHVAPGTEVIAVKDAFKASSDIETSDLYDIPHFNYEPNDPQRGQQWHITRTQCYEAWDLFRGDTTSYGIVGISDTGIYWMHGDLAANMWVNEWEDINGNGTMDDGDINGLDDDGNGYTDDVIGWDFGVNDNDPREESPTHGTHVAGDVSEVTDNNTQGAGIGFGVRIMAAKGANRSNQLTAVYQAMTYCSENGAHVINCSWGSSYFNQGNQNLINGIWANGVVIVAAAGNDNAQSRFYPAAYNNVYAVAATNSSDRKASFSNYGDWIDISAPGQGIYATWAQNSFMSLDGTSMASPITAGLCGLLKAANPTWTNQDIISTVSASADNIDDINPSYAGLLGAGRVNAFSALGSANYPKLLISDRQITQTSDDGDGILNPGESFNLVITLNNIWADAHNVNAMVSGSNFTFADSASLFGDVLHGQSVNNSADPYRITVNANAVPDSLPLTLVVTADSNYLDSLTVKIGVSLNQVGFPKDINANVESSPVFADVDNDQALELVIGASDASVNIFEANGNSSVGWPKTTTSEVLTGPAVGDLDHDGDKEVVATSKDGKIYAWHSDGAPLAGFPVVKGGNFYGGPTLVDVNGDNNYEIIVGSFTSNMVYLIDNNGADHAGWPTPAINRWYGSASVGNLDGDQFDEIIFAGFDSSVHVWNGDGTSIAGFPVHLDATVYTSVAVGDVDEDTLMEIAAVTYSGKCYLINNDGSIAAGFPVNVASQIRSGPVLADLDHDGDLEIIFGSSNGQLNIYDNTGAAYPGFPYNAGGSIFGSPVVGDISGDGQPDIVFGSTNGNLYGLDRNGVLLPNFPIPGSTARQITGSAALGDLDSDGDMEIAYGIKASGQNIVVLDYKAAASMNNLVWPCFGRDIHRSNNFGQAVTGVEDTPQVPTGFSVAQNYPNPFNAATQIRYTLKNSGEASLSIYDIMGRRIVTLNSGRVSAGEHEFIWNGGDHSGKTVSSGVYFYKLESAEGSMTRRMLLLK